MLLEVRGVTVCYDSVPAVRDINLYVEEGEAIGLLGLNGAGKTTMLYAISGLLKPASGEIWFKGRRIDGWPPHKIVKLGIIHIPEGRRLFPFMTAGENLKLGAYVRRRKEAERDLEQLERTHPLFRERRNQLAGSFSGGEQQKLAFGRGLMGAPQLLLMDEPTLGLSPVAIAEISEMIKNLTLAKLPVILVEQNIKFALKLTKRCYILERGKILTESVSSELAGSEYLKKVLLGG